MLPVPHRRPARQGEAAWLYSGHLAWMQGPKMPMAGASCMERRAYMDSLRNSTATPWRSLSEERSRAWTLLGFDEEGSMWTEEELPGSFASKFSLLTVEQSK